MKSFSYNSFMSYKLPSKRMNNKMTSKFANVLK